MKLYQAIRVDEVSTLCRHITVLRYASLPVFVFWSCQGGDLFHMNSDFSTVTVSNCGVVD
jgi:hypothetical protein